MAQNGLPLVKEFEGCELTAYQDSVGVWTIGYGHTKGVYSGMTITEDEAADLLLQDYESAESQVVACLTQPYTQNQLGALTSFVYNLGVGNLKSSTLLREFNAGTDPQTVALQFPRWDLAGGQVSAGLLRRRQAEAALFLTPDPTSDTVGENNAPPTNATSSDNSPLV